MRYVVLLALALAGSPVDDQAISRPQLAVTCFKSGEQRSGQYKICYYRCLGSTVAITVKRFELCPLSIRR